MTEDRTSGAYEVEKETPAQYQTRIDATAERTALEPAIWHGLEQPAGWSPVSPYDDIGNMSNKQRRVYFLQMCTAELANLNQNGNFVGEKPARSVTVEQMARERESAWQRHVVAKANGDVG